MYNPQYDIKAQTAAIYARVSSPNQKYNYSIDGQIEQSLKLCEQREWEVKYIFIDEAESAKDLNRTKFPIMLEKAKQGLFDVLVMWKLDRLFRSLADTVNTERTLQKYNVNLCSVTEYIDTTTPVGRFNFRSLASVAEFERELIGERSRMGLYGLARQHKWPNSYPPYGYDKDLEGKLVKNTEEAKIISHLYKRYLSVKSMPQLAYELNHKGITTKKGNSWTSNSIKQLLINQLYKGNFRVAGYEAYIKDHRIISDELYQQVQDTRLRHKHGKISRPPVKKSRRRRKIDHMMTKFSDYIADTESHPIV